MSHSNDPLEYAQKFVELPLDGSKYLALRDVPPLIKKYVKGEKTLDFGCGPGKSTLFLKSLGLEVKGVDINKYMVKAAEENDPLGTYNQIENGKLEEEDGYYDLVHASWVLVHASTKEELFGICKDIARVLKVGGTFISVGNSNDTYDNNEWLSVDNRCEENVQRSSGSTIKIKFKANNFNLYAYYWSEADYCEAIEKAGLTTVCIHKSYGKDTDGYNWVNEKEKAFLSIIVAQKLS